MPDPLDRDFIAERVLFAFYIYPNYRVDSRGPAGCLVDILRAARPDIADAFSDGEANEVYARFFDEDGCARAPNPPAEAANEGSDLHYCDHDTGPHICDDRCDGHTVKEMEAYDAGRASLEKRVELLDAFVASVESYIAGNALTRVAMFDRIAELKRELSADGTKGT